MITFASGIVGDSTRLQASLLEMREGEIHTLLLDFLHIDQQQKGGGAPGINLASWRAEYPSSYRLPASMNLSLQFPLTHIVWSFIHPSVPHTPVAQYLSHVHIFCLSSPTLALFSHKWILPQPWDLLRCTSCNASSYLQSQAGVSAPSADRSPHSKVMSSLLTGFWLEHSLTWLWSELAAGSISEDKLPPPKLWQRTSKLK